MNLKEFLHQIWVQSIQIRLLSELMYSFHFVHFALHWVQIHKKFMILGTKKCCGKFWFFLIAFYYLSKTRSMYDFNLFTSNVHSSSISKILNAFHLLLVNISIQFMCIVSGDIWFYMEKWLSLMFLTKVNRKWHIALYKLFTKYIFPHNINSNLMHYVKWIEFIR